MSLWQSASDRSSLWDRSTVLQREYYARTASAYDDAHVASEDEHSIALGFLTGILDWLGCVSVLDVGSGTGRAMRVITATRPQTRVVGLEPVKELREIARHHGAGRPLVSGDALRLPFAAERFDVVCAFGLLHHVATPGVVIDEMLRVARLAVFISDINNFGAGGPIVRTLKQLIHAVGLWPLANRIKTLGRGYRESEGDGISYSYSVFTDHQRIRSQCSSVHVVNTRGDGGNPYRSASHVALLGLKGGDRRPPSLNGR